MICPYCDSRIGVLPDNRSCPHCGAPLATVIQEQKPQRQFPVPPVGKYLYGDGYLEIGYDSVTIYKKQIFRKTKRTIPFSQIAGVSFGDGQNDASGFLCVRHRQAAHLPLVTRAIDAVPDDTSVYFFARRSPEFYPVYMFLKKCADIANGVSE